MESKTVKGLLYFQLKTFTNFVSIFEKTEKQILTEKQIYLFSRTLYDTRERKRKK
jgi:hypothetical protein